MYIIYIYSHAYATSSCHVQLKHINIPSGYQTQFGYPLFIYMSIYIDIYIYICKYVHMRPTNFHWV